MVAANILVPSALVANANHGKRDAVVDVELHEPLAYLSCTIEPLLSPREVTCTDVSEATPCEVTLISVYAPDDSAGADTFDQVFPPSLLARTLPWFVRATINCPFEDIDTFVRFNPDDAATPDHVTP